MDQAAATFVAIGVLLLAALLADVLSRRSHIPQVTILLLIGVAAGPAVFDVLPAARETWEPVVTELALVMVGFLIGSDLRMQRLRAHGRSVLVLATSAALATAVVVAGGLVLLGADTRLALALGGIAAATAPAATVAVIDETDADGPLTRTLIGIVAVDDALSITFFSLLVAAAAVITGSGGVAGIVGDAVREVGGGVLLGVVIGLPAAALTGRLERGRPTLLEALALVFLTAGLGVALDVSFLLAAIVAGAVVANLARHHEHTFRAIERIEWPFLAVFFVIGGAAFDTTAFTEHAALVTGYVVLRSVGRVVGGRVGALQAGSPPPVERWIGVTLLPQAGVALGLALLARDRFPEVADVIVPVVVVSTVLFELVGPVLTRLALERAGEAGSDRDEAGSARRGS